jgi:hypothetical protein
MARMKQNVTLVNSDWTRGLLDRVIDIVAGVGQALHAG